MDEPFSALDALTRGALQDEVIAIRRATRQTDVHDHPRRRRGVAARRQDPADDQRPVQPGSPRWWRTRCPRSGRARSCTSSPTTIRSATTSSTSWSRARASLACVPGRARASAAGRPSFVPQPQDHRPMSRRPRNPPRQPKRRPPIVTAAELPWRKPSARRRPVAAFTVLRSARAAGGQPSRRRRGAQPRNRRNPGSKTDEARRAHREDPRHQAREGLELEVHHRRDRRHVAGAGGRRAARPDEAGQAAGGQGAPPCSACRQPRSAC